MILAAKSTQTASKDDAAKPPIVVLPGNAIQDPGCAPLTALTFDGPPSEATLKILFGKPLQDWTPRDISKFKSIVDVCRPSIRSIANYPPGLYQAEMKRFIEWLTHSVEVLAGQKLAAVKEQAILAEARALAEKADKSILLDSEVERLRQVIVEAKNVAADDTKKGYLDLHEAATAAEIAEQGMRAYEFHKRDGRLIEESRLKEEQKRKEVENEERLAKERQKRKIEEAARDGYTYMPFLDLTLEKSKIKGKQIVVEGFLTVRQNAGILDFPTVGAIVVDLAELALDDRRLLATECTTEQARCYVAVRGTVQDIETDLAKGVGILADRVKPGSP
jgi:hypothetical protein